MSDDDNGSRQVRIETASYSVSVTGNADDDLADVLDVAERAADRAMGDRAKTEDSHFA
jgi:hypothetical protein